jgi:hypothetical protein
MAATARSGYAQERSHCYETVYVSTGEPDQRAFGFRDDR